MTLSPELLAIIKDVKPASDERLEVMTRLLSTYNPLGVHWDSIDILSLIARVSELQRWKDVRAAEITEDQKRVADAERQRDEWHAAFLALEERP